MPQLFDSLIGFDHANGMALRPALAERWERVDAQSLRLFLRKGVAFHDGSPLTAEDVAFSLGPDHLLALQLLCLWASESMGNHDSNVVDAGRVG